MLWKSNADSTLFSPKEPIPNLSLPFSCTPSILFSSFNFRPNSRALGFLHVAVSAPLAPGAAGGDSPGGLAEEPSPRGIDEFRYIYEKFVRIWPTFIGFLPEFAQICDLTYLDAELV
jgi:hypothetical protein